MNSVTASIGRAKADLQNCMAEERGIAEIRANLGALETRQHHGISASSDSTAPVALAVRQSTAPSDPAALVDPAAIYPSASSDSAASTAPAVRQSSAPSDPASLVAPAARNPPASSNSAVLVASAARQPLRQPSAWSASTAPAAHTARHYLRDSSDLPASAA